MFHCGVSAAVTRIVLRSVSELRGISGVAEQQGTLRGTSFTEQESQETCVYLCVCDGRMVLCLLCKCDLKMTSVCNSYVDPYLESQE